MPLTVGGGVRNAEDVRLLLKAGADKVSVNTAALQNPDMVRESAKMFGSQCIVVSIDAKSDGRGGYDVLTHSGKKATGIDPVKWAVRAEELGAGEILLTSVDRDGTKEGYDIELTQKVSDAVSIPVIASGGVGKLSDFVDGIVSGHASAVAAASIFLFTQFTPKNAKEYMKQHGIDVRL
jgi:cyclase